VNDNTEKAEDRIRQQIEYFLDSLKNIIADTHNSRIDYYFVVSQLKNRDFFSEVLSFGFRWQELLKVVLLVKI